MSMIIKCDRCGREIKGSEYLYDAIVYEYEPFNRDFLDSYKCGKESYNICSDCAHDFALFIGGVPILKERAEM